MKYFDITAFDKLHKLMTTFTKFPAESEAMAVNAVRRTIVNETGTPGKFIVIKKIRLVG